jgi:hypothetical protein
LIGTITAFRGDHDDHEDSCDHDDRDDPDDREDPMATTTVTCCRQSCVSAGLVDGGEGPAGC